MCIICQSTIHLICHPQIPNSGCDICHRPHSDLLWAPERQCADKKVSPHSAILSTIHQTLPNEYLIVLKTIPCGFLLYRKRQYPTQTPLKMKSQAGQCIAYPQA